VTETSGWKDAEEARERAREAVAGAFAKTPDAAPTRRCPTCGTEAATLAARCPNCNKRYDRALPWLKDWMRWTLAVVTLAGLAALAVALRPGIQETKQERSTRLAREQSQRVSGQRAKLIRAQRPVKGRDREYRPLPAGAPEPEQRVRRRSLVLALEAAITAEAKARIERRELDGPVKFTECGPLIRNPSSQSDDEVVTRRLGRYDCVAVKSDVRRFGRTVALFGHPFVGTVDFTTGRYVFCKDNKVPGERGKALAAVKLAPECLGLKKGAEEVGEGYVQPDE
jgi:hypothetical protein